MLLYLIIFLFIYNLKFDWTELKLVKPNTKYTDYKFDIKNYDHNFDGRKLATFPVKNKKKKEKKESK